MKRGLTRPEFLCAINILCPHHNYHNSLMGLLYKHCSANYVAYYHFILRYYCIVIIFTVLLGVCHQISTSLFVPWFIFTVLPRAWSSKILTTRCGMTMFRLFERVLSNKNVLYDGCVQYIHKRATRDKQHFRFGIHSDNAVRCTMRSLTPKCDRNRIRKYFSCLYDNENIEVKSLVTHSLLVP